MGELDLFVAGSGCVLGDYPRNGKKSVRKLYIDDFFATEEKRIIADNYQAGKKSILKNRRKSSLKFVKTDPIEVVHREVLQIPCFIYPRFNDVYPWRGRRSLCKHNPPDTLYNDSVRRIQFASILDDLKCLSNYQTKIAKYALKAHQKQQSHLSAHRLTESEKFQPAKDSHRQTSAIIRRSLRKRVAEKRKLGDIESNNIHCFRTKEDDNDKNDWWWQSRGATTSTTTTCPGGKHSRFLADDSQADKLLQLASDFYDEGLLGHLRYLERVGERKAINEATESEANLTTNVAIPVSSYSTRSKLRHLNGRNLFTNTIRRIVHTKRPAINRNRRIPLRNFDEAITQSSQSAQSDCRIRVEITSASSRANRVRFEHQPEHQRAKSEQVHSKYSPVELLSPPENSLDGSESMRSFVTTSDSNNQHYGSFSSRVQQNANVNPENNLIRTVDRYDNVHELISSLYRLDIAAELGSLPKIVLTDYSSSQDTSATSTPSFIVSSASSGQVGSSKPVNFVELNDINRCLNIPSETNYRSEARPP